MLDVEIVPTYAEMVGAATIKQPKLTFFLVKNDEQVGQTNTLYMSWEDGTIKQLGAGGSGTADLSSYYTKSQVDSHAADITITDATKGFVLTTPTGEHIRLTASIENAQPQISITVI